MMPIPLTSLPFGFPQPQASPPTTLQGIYSFLNDQPSADFLAQNKSQMINDRNATSIPTFVRPNLDQNAMQPDDLMRYNFYKQLSLPQERL